MLDKHNELRSTIALGNQGSHPSAANMIKMQWSDELAQVAQNYAEQCVFEHNNDRQRQQNTFSTVGENLGAGTGEFTTDGFIQNWFDEEENYDFSSNSCSGQCGQYTQVVWATSYAVGCGAFRCANLQNFLPNSVNVVCNYGPGGNIIGLTPYTSGVPASDCPVEFPFAEEGTGLCTDVEPEPEPVVETDDSGGEGNSNDGDNVGEEDGDTDSDDSASDDGDGKEDDSSSTDDDTSTLDECECESESSILNLLLSILQR